MTPCNLGAGGPCRGAAWIMNMPRKVTCQNNPRTTWNVHSSVWSDRWESIRRSSMIIAKSSLTRNFVNNTSFHNGEHSERTPLPGILLLPGMLLALSHLAESQQEEGYHDKEATSRQCDHHYPETGDASLFENWWKECDNKRCPGESDNLLRPQGHHSSDLLIRHQKKC